MINVTRFTCVRKAVIINVTGLEDQLCPYCGGNLFVHGTCKRHLKTTGGNVILRLRVMECRKCGATHREMPHGLVPYRRYSAEMLCAIFTGYLPEKNEDTDSIDTRTSVERKEYAEDACMCDPSIRQRIIEWLSCFLTRVQNMAEIRSDRTLASDSICCRLKRYVRILINSGKWKQHRFTMPSS